MIHYLPPFTRTWQNPLKESTYPKHLPFFYPATLSAMQKRRRTAFVPSMSGHHQGVLSGWLRVSNDHMVLITFCPKIPAEMRQHFLGHLLILFPVPVNHSWKFWNENRCSHNAPQNIQKLLVTLRSLSACQKLQKYVVVLKRTQSKAVS